jgi:hypothetical protein
MKKSNLIEAAASLAEAETNSRPCLAAMDGSARIPITGLKQPRVIRGTVWTPEEDAFLKENLGIISMEEIGLTLGRTTDAIHNRWERDLHLPAPRRNPNWLTLEAFARGLCVDSHSIGKLADRGLISTRRLPAMIAKNGRGAIRVIERKAALAWIANPMHWIYFKPERVGTFRKQGQRWMAKPDVVFWREARADVEERRRTWEDVWLTPTEAAHLIGLPVDKRNRVCHGINKAINLQLLKAVRWGNWRILQSEVLKFAHDRVADNWGPRKIRWIRFSERKGGSGGKDR